MAGGTITGCPRFLSALAAFEQYPGLSRGHTVKVSELHRKAEKDENYFKEKLGDLKRPCPGYAVDGCSPLLSDCCCALWLQLTLHQPLCMSCCSSNIPNSFSPQDLCTYCFSNFQHDLLPHVLNYLVKCHLLMNTFPDSISNMLLSVLNSALFVHIALLSKSICVFVCFLFSYLVWVFLFGWLVVWS